MAQSDDLLKELETFLQTRQATMSDLLFLPPTARAFLLRVIQLQEVTLDTLQAESGLSSHDVADLASRLEASGLFARQEGSSPCKFRVTLMTQGSRLARQSAANNLWDGLL